MIKNTYIDYKVIPENIPNSGILYVDHQKDGRSGHLSHALVEYKKGCVMSFYSNCSGTRNKGHNGFGWIEYRRSLDGGVSWEEPTVLPYSWDAFINEPFTVGCEKAVSTQENEIIAFFARCCNPNGWEPYLEPTVVISHDGGQTWDEPAVFCDKRGRIYDAFALDGSVFVLFHAAPDWLAKDAEEKYYIYQSDDHGKNFFLKGTLPGDPTDHAYGTMTLRRDGALICYTYNKADEYNLDYSISYDMGSTWAESGKSYLPKRIRNPQIARSKDGFFLHGRSGCESKELPFNFVLYSSKDGINWDEGQYLCQISSAKAYYSNNLVLSGDDGSERILIQSSVPQKEIGGTVNVAHWFLEINPH